MPRDYCPADGFADSIHHVEFAPARRTIKLFDLVLQSQVCHINALHAASSLSVENVVSGYQLQITSTNANANPKSHIIGMMPFDSDASTPAAYNYASALLVATIKLFARACIQQVIADQYHAHT